MATAELRRLGFELLYFRWAVLPFTLPQRSKMLKPMQVNVERKVNNKDARGAEDKAKAETKQKEPSLKKFPALPSAQAEPLPSLLPQACHDDALQGYALRRSYAQTLSRGSPVVPPRSCRSTAFSPGTLSQCTANRTDTSSKEGAKEMELDPPLHDLQKKWVRARRSKRAAWKARAQPWDRPGGARASSENHEECRRESLIIRADLVKPTCPCSSVPGEPSYPGSHRTQTLKGSRRSIVASRRSRRQQRKDAQRIDLMLRQVRRCSQDPGWNWCKGFAQILAHKTGLAISSSQVRRMYRNHRRSTAQLRIKLWHRQNLACAACNTVLSRMQATLDHKRPVVDGGRTMGGNCQVLCDECNQTKGDEW